MASFGENPNLKDLARGDLEVGSVLPWNLYSNSGAMLLSKGLEIKSESQLGQLIKVGAKYSLLDASDTIITTEQHNTSENISDGTPKSGRSVSFMLIEEFATQLEKAFATLEAGKPKGFISKILRLVIEIQTACDENSDAMLGSLALTLSLPHRIDRPLNNAILCEICARNLQKDPIERISIMAASLTCDLGMLSLMDEMFNQEESLYLSQQEQIKAHPEESVRLLETLGVSDKKWLKTVLQHHERVDGSGYPAGLSGDSIYQEAKLLAIADNYTALVRPRAYRKHILHQDILRELMQERGKLIDESLMRVFVNSIGLYAPGSIVKTKSGATAIVTGHKTKITEPELLIVCAKGSSKPLDEPKRVTADQDRFKIETLMCPRECQELINKLGTIWPMQHPLALQSGYVY